MNGYFSAVKNRDKSNENYKDSLRKNLREQKYAYIDTKKTKNKFDFPKLTQEELNDFKNQLKEKENINVKKTILFYALLFIIAILFANYIYNLKV